MSSSQKKWIAFSFLAFSALLSYLLSTLLHFLSLSYDWEAKVRHVDTFIQGGTLGAGLLCFLLLFLNPRIHQFMGEVVLELSRVTWPTPRETAMSTWVVTVMVLISGFVLGLLDYLWTQLLSWVIG